MPKSRCAGGRCDTSRPAISMRAGVLRLQAGDHAQQRGLAAARGAEEADELALLHLQRDVVERGEGAEALGHRPDAQVHGVATRPHGRRARADAAPCERMRLAVTRARRLPSPLRGGAGGGVSRTRTSSQPLPPPPSPSPHAGGEPSA